jgi:hypothetical protein
MSHQNQNHAHDPGGWWTCGVLVALFILAGTWLGR